MDTDKVVDARVDARRLLGSRLQNRRDRLLVGVRLRRIIMLRPHEIAVLLVDLLGELLALAKHKPKAEWSQQRRHDQRPHTDRERIGRHHHIAVAVREVLITILTDPPVPVADDRLRIADVPHTVLAPLWFISTFSGATEQPSARSQTARRLEHRVAGADANPYLLFAVVLGAMLDGIEQNLSPGDPISGDGYTQEEAKLPEYMPDAVRLFSESDFIRNNLGNELQRIYTLTKQQELEEFRKRISLLEYQSYLEKL